MSKSTAKAIVTSAGIMPLDYLLQVMRDENATPQRRDRAATTAAQYLHKRMADTRVPLKTRAARAAQEVGGGEWADDLDYSDGKPQ
jgi:hypothetical protein